MKQDDGGKTIKPHKDHFDGEVIVLVGPANSSGSTHVIAKLVDSARVRTVGARTGGNPRGATAGSLVFMKLPHSGITVRVPLQRIVLNVTTLEDGQPIVPDVLIERSPDELFDTSDRVLEAARALEPLPGSDSGSN